MSSSGPAPSAKKMSGLGCQLSWPPTSMAALTDSGSPIAPSSSSARPAWKGLPRKMSGAQAIRSPQPAGFGDEGGRVCGVHASGFSV